MRKFATPIFFLCSFLQALPLAHAATIQQKVQLKDQSPLSITLTAKTSNLNEAIVIGCADPRGAAMYELFKHGQAKATPGGSITEGIGLGRVTPIIEQAKVDEAYLIPDDEAVPVIYELLEHEGLCLGGSTGVNVAGAIRLANDLGPGKTIVTILCDHGSRYQSKLFNPEFLKERGLPTPPWI